MIDRIADLHCDSALEIQGGADLVAGNPEGHVDLDRLERGGVKLQVFVSYVSSAFPEERAFAEACGLIDGVEDLCLRSGGRLAKADGAADAERALKKGAETVAILAVENGHAIAGEIANLERLRRRGVRYMTLTHSGHLSWAAGSGQPLAGTVGLSSFGKKVVEAMNDLGVIVDVSHVHESTFWDVAARSKKPFIASHSDAAALCPTPRNLTDDQLRAVADSGGLVGVNFFPGLLDPDYERDIGASLGDLFARLREVELRTIDDARSRLSEYRRLFGEMRERTRSRKVPLDLVVDHIEHIMKIAGEDAVAFGSDFDGAPELPEGLGDCSSFPRLLERMRERGFRESAIEKIAYGNFLRVLSEADR